MAEALKKKITEQDLAAIQALTKRRDAERLRLALAAAGAMAFDWTIADDTIVWDGATDVLALHPDSKALEKGSNFLAWLSADSQSQLDSLISTASAGDVPFEMELEAPSAMGSIWLRVVGVRVAGLDGKAERLSGALRIVTEQRRDMQRLLYLATRDELTGQLNRNALRLELSKSIEAARGENRSCAFLVASIDRLAMINDAYGFDAADEVILEVGARLAKSLNGNDVIGRTAGNKFGMIRCHCAQSDITALAKRLRSAVRNTVIDTKAGAVSATISVAAVLLPTGASSSQEAMLRAEETLERARNGGRDGFAVYAKSPQLETARLRLMGIADELQAALREDRLVLTYQPIVDACGRNVVYHECLLRMKRKDGSMALAGQFIPAAEQLGLVRLVDRRALEMTVAQLKKSPEINLAVNVSGTAASDAVWLQDFVDYVSANREIAPRLIVELTETAALHHFEENARFVSQLRELGCRVAIDDFGAGYTSFRNLQMLRADTVKIDGAFVANLAKSPENQVFVRTLVHLAKSFRLKIVAEWVDSEETASLLERFGVDCLQGFYLGKPVLAPDYQNNTAPRAALCSFDL